MPLSPTQSCSSMPENIDAAVLLSDNKSMKVTVELSDSELKDVCRLTGERKKGPAVRKLVIDALTMRKREEIAEKFITGQWGTELAGFESSRSADRAAAEKRGSKWRK